MLLKPTSPPSIRVWKVTEGIWQPWASGRCLWQLSDWRSSLCVLELSVKRRVSFIMSLIMPWFMEVNNIVPSAAVVQGQQSIEFTHCFPTLKHTWRSFSFMFFFLCYNQWESMLLVLNYRHVSQCFMAGRWFNGGFWVNGEGTERRQIKEHTCLCTFRCNKFMKIVMWEL